MRSAGQKIEYIFRIVNLFLQTLVTGKKTTDFNSASDKGIIILRCIHRLLDTSCASSDLLDQFLENIPKFDGILVILYLEI